MKQIKINFVKKYNFNFFYKNLFKNIALKIINEEKLKKNNFEIEVIFVDSQEIKKLNFQHRGKNYSTDVLAFPNFFKIDKNQFFLGQIFICIEKIKEQAILYNHSFKREINYIFTHAFFHILGYDHKTKTEKFLMDEKVEKVMDFFHILRS